MMVNDVNEYNQPDLDEVAMAGTRGAVAVVIPTFNHAHFLADAIGSVMAQTHPADEIIVVDDGSTDNPGSIVAQFPKVRLIRQDNRGLSAARNTGLQSCTTSHVVFLDADDRLLPIALETGLKFANFRTDCAFIYGGYRLISENGGLIDPFVLSPVYGDPHVAFLRRNLIGAPCSVMYRRDCLLAIGGFDETLRRLEDHDIYLRITQRYSIASHSEIVAEYRKHGRNMSNNFSEQLRVALEVLDRHAKTVFADPIARSALREGRKHKREYYVSAMVSAARDRWHAEHDVRTLVRDLIQAARWSPRVTGRLLIGDLRRRIKLLLGAIGLSWKPFLGSMLRIFKRNDA
jgi:glycosyltransferase involved in cell wall biosynthesis